LARNARAQLSMGCGWTMHCEQFAGSEFWRATRGRSLRTMDGSNPSPRPFPIASRIGEICGLASPEGGTVQAHRLAQASAEVNALPLPASAGEAFLTHNHIWHRSGVNRTPYPRRALDISYLHGDTRCLRKRRAPRHFEKLFTHSPLAEPHRPGQHRRPQSWHVYCM
jgi:hypothetical protein